ncbi:MAG: hypothetical protein JHC93_06845, partial [Parachlamydiales bacterium]|nr:hypothetical protein [Parachlamydiales bacterium]
MQRLFALFFLALTTLQAQLPTPYILEDTTYSKFQSPYCVNIGSGGFFCEEVDAIVDGP